MNLLQNYLIGPYFRPFSTNSYGYLLSNGRKSDLNQLILRNDPQSPTVSWAATDTVLS